MPGEGGSRGGWERRRVAECSRVPAGRYGEDDAWNCVCEQPERKRLGFLCRLLGENAEGTVLEKRQEILTRVFSVDPRYDWHK